MEEKVQSAGQTPSTGRLHQCQECQKSFKQLCHLKEHLQKVHKVDAKKKEGFCAPIATCGKGPFYTVELLYSHCEEEHAGKIGTQ